MADTPIGGPSLLLASHDKAHREHQAQHYLLHRADPSIIQSIVTEILATVSVIQQSTVDPTGNAIGLNAYTVDFTGGTSHPPTTLTSSSTSSTTTATPGTSGPIPTLSSTGAEGLPVNNLALSPPSTYSLLSLDTASVATPTPTSIPIKFASIPIGSNLTSLILTSSNTLSPILPTSNSYAPTFINSSLTLSTSSSALSSFSGSFSSSISNSIANSLLTGLSSSSATFSSGSYSTVPSSSAPSFYPSSTPSSSPFASYQAGTLVSGTWSASGSTPASTPASSSGAGSDGDSGDYSDDSSAPPTSTVVGGVIGGLAGLAILIFLFMFLIRWRRRKQSMISLGGEEMDASAGAGRSAPSQTAAGMTERSGFGALSVSATLASLTGYKRSSQNAVGLNAGSERGFYRVSGRKLPSVLQSGGDGYGGGTMGGNTMSGSSFYRDSQSFYGDCGGTQRDSGVPIMREGPARTPVTEHSPFSDFPDFLNPPPPRPDAAGRVPSQDGSQRSRFTEEV
ncbi:hypothetical protein QTJ16_001621 [Diplocarpon rosae]|uniref:Uncharacterized protein n=1 Tax=Diplocarpon rosae TaxID=946125 RepID=A0AAD9WFR8_9HELO|nr:hypothetical protein QTJ16_001621 [Diplocarpon rosae]